MLSPQPDSGGTPHQPAFPISLSQPDATAHPPPVPITLTKMEAPDSVPITLSSHSFSQPPSHPPVVF